MPSNDPLRPQRPHSETTTVRLSHLTSLRLKEAAERLQVCHLAEVQLNGNLVPTGPWTMDETLQYLLGQGLKSLERWETRLAKRRLAVAATKVDPSRGTAHTE